MKQVIQSRLNVIKGVLLRKNCLLLFFVILATYFGVNIWINRFYDVIPVIYTYRLVFVIPYLLLAIAIGLGVALSLTITLSKLGEAVALKRGMGMTTVSAIGGLLGGGCPSCFAGLFPSVAGVFGLTLTLSSLPLSGFEIQILTLVTVLITLIWVANPTTCTVDIKQ